MLDNNSLLFWLEREPFESIEESNLFLPPDTPIANPTAHTLKQIKTKKALRQKRALIRLENYYLGNRQKLKSDLEKIVDVERLPVPTSSKLDIKSGPEFMRTDAKKITGFFDDLYAFTNKKTGKPSKLPKPSKSSKTSKSSKAKTSTNNKGKAVKDDTKEISYRAEVEASHNAKLTTLQNQFETILRGLST